MAWIDRVRSIFAPNTEPEARGYGEDAAAARFAQVFGNADGLGGITPKAALEVSVVSACIQKSPKQSRLSTWMSTGSKVTNKKEYLIH